MRQVHHRPNVGNELNGNHNSLHAHLIEQQISSENIKKNLLLSSNVVFSIKIPENLQTMFLNIKRLQKLITEKVYFYSIRVPKQLNSYLVIQLFSYLFPNG